MKYFCVQKITIINQNVIILFIFEEFWKYDPFSAHKDKNGDIFARGAQDMKCVGIQYIETIRKYLKDKLVFDRTIHMSFVPGLYFLLMM